VRQNLTAEGDHLWLRVERLEVTQPPKVRALAVAASLPCFAL
jgi:hypothetical protein